MNKKFCINCTSFKKHVYVSYGIYPDKCSVDDESFPQTRSNINLNCKYYRRKWWKFGKAK